MIPPAPSVTLLMAMHCHQPVGNFGFVFEEAFRKAYEPFLTALERHPTVRLSLHYSGSLLDWLEAEQPHFLDRVARLASQGQVEVLAGGYYEPILPLIPEADRQGQIALMRRTIRRRFGTEARGLWLTERVWEPELPTTLADAGIAYTMLDTNQFASARSTLPTGLRIEDQDGWDVLGAYLTEHDGAAVGLFPASKRLRYWLPFQEPERTVNWLRRLAGFESLAVTFADDGEKFGLWPKTFAWVYEQGWLERFFSALERESSWLKTATFQHYWTQTGPSGRVYLPCGSYEEMLEWSDGYFRNFFVKYPEANAMRQKMLHVSRRLQAVSGFGMRGSGSHAKRATRNATRALLEQARRELYMAQCNCAYWHGVFGGLYLSHLRRTVYSHLIAAEQRLQAVEGRTTSVALEDLDGDGRMEIILRTPRLHVVVDPAEGGGITEWDDLHRTVNLVDTVSRRPEAYHAKLKAAHASGAAGGSSAPASIHDLVTVNEHGLEALLTYDDHRRISWLDYGFTTLPTLQQVMTSAWREHQLWAGGAWELLPVTGRRNAAVTLQRAIDGGQLRKSVQLSNRRPHAQFRYEVSGTAASVVALEFNLGLCDEEWRQPTWQPGVTTARLQDAGLGLALSMSSDCPMTLASFPIETVSESERGLERTYQGLALVYLWGTGGRSPWSCALEWTLEEAR